MSDKTTQSTTTQDIAVNGLVDGETLLKIVFPVEKCRPSIRTLERRAKSKAIPSVRLGRLRFYNPPDVMATLLESSAKRGGAR